MVLNPIPIDTIDEHLLWEGEVHETHRRVVQDSPNIPIFDLIKRVDTLHSVVEELVEDEANSRSSREFVQREVVGVPVDGGAEF